MSSNSNSHISRSISSSSLVETPRPNASNRTFDRAHTNHAGNNNNNNNNNNNDSQSSSSSSFLKPSPSSSPSPSSNLKSVQETKQPITNTNTNISTTPANQQRPKLTKRPPHSSEALPSAFRMLSTAAFTAKFNIFGLVEYLSKTKHQGVRDYLVNQLFDMDLMSVEFMLPQLWYENEGVKNE